MPTHRVHRLIDKLLLKREYPDVHRWVDEPYRWLGPRHRVLRHSPIEVVIKYWGDPARMASGLLHILADRAESRLKARLRRVGRCRGRRLRLG